MLSEQVTHEPQQYRFLLSRDGQHAILEYQFGAEQSGAQSVDFKHTFVPPALRGQGVGDVLVKHGLEWARRNDYHIRASCPFAAKILHES